MEKKSSYNFPELIMALRKSYGTQRKEMFREIGISEMRLMFLEMGKVSKFIRASEVEKLAQYYELDTQFLLEKAICFIVERKGNLKSEVVPK